jgi:hypothetical protein
MKITVTSQDIENGRRCDPDCCPVGRALMRAGLLHYGVHGNEVILLDVHHDPAILRLPEEVVEWILCYDGHRPVEPFSFELPLPWERKHKERVCRSTSRKRTARRPAAKRTAERHVTMSRSVALTHA